MPEKILFLLDLWFFHYGIAKSLQESEKEFEMYAIIDIGEKAQKFFDEQKFVDFKKKYVYLDNVKVENKKPNLEYLKLFEERYGINLWHVAYTDRAFYQYNKMHNFTKNEILYTLEQECRFFEQVLDEVKPDFIALYLTISHHQYLLSEMCKSRGIKNLMIVPTKSGKRIMISENDNKIDYFSKESLHKNKSVIDLDDYYKSTNPFEHVQKTKEIAFDAKKMDRYKSLFKYFFSDSDKEYNKRFNNFGRTKLSTIKERFSRSIKRKLREKFIDQNFSRTIGNGSFIYFPLHYEPERILLINAPYFDNQLSVITNIAKSIPIGYTLLVKEHPFMQTIGWRDTSYYKTIMKLPNVKLIHHTVTPEEIIKKSSLVITIGGTVGIEAATFKKPCITLVDTIYSIINSVHKLEKFDDLPFLIKKCLNEEIIDNNMNEFINIINDNSFELEIGEISTDFAFQFGLKGLIQDAELPIDKIDRFLKKYHTVFDLLGREHIKKIEQHRTNLNQK